MRRAKLRNIATAQCDYAPWANVTPISAGRCATAGHMAAAEALSLVVAMRALPAE